MDNFTPFENSGPVSFEGPDRRHYLTDFTYAFWNENKLF